MESSQARSAQDKKANQKVEDGSSTPQYLQYQPISELSHSRDVKQEVLQEENEIDTEKAVNEEDYAILDDSNFKDLEFEKLEESKTEFIIKPNIIAEFGIDRQKQILREFNKDPDGVTRQDLIIEPTFVRSAEYLEPDEFFLAHLNKQPKLEIGLGRRLTLAWQSWNDQKAVINAHVKQTKPFFGAHGHYVFTVPPGKYGLAWSNTKQKIYGTGTHVILDPSFRFEKDRSDPVRDFDEKKHLVDQNKDYIRHGNITILRVPPSKECLAKVTVNNVPKLLSSSVEPYYFDTALFGPFEDRILAENEEKKEVGGFIPASRTYIKNGTLHRVIVPPKSYALIIDNNIPKILKPRNDGKPYYFDSNNFKYISLVSQTNLAIDNQNLHLLRVPPGQFARVTVDGVQKLLKPKKDNKPYLFNTMNYKLEEFVSQTKLYIQAGTRHRFILPKGYFIKAKLEDRYYLLGASPEKDKEFKEKIARSSKLFQAEGLSNPDTLIFDFDNSQFSIVTDQKDQEQNMYYRATEPVITHGPITRVRTPDNQLSIMNKGGKLLITDQVHYTEDENESFNKFFSTTDIDIHLPQALDKKEEYIVLTMKDFVPIGAKIFVSIQIENAKRAQLALNRFGTLDKIIAHVKDVVRAEMLKIMQKHDSTEYLSSTSPNSEKKETDPVALHEQKLDESAESISGLSETLPPLSFAPVLIPPKPSAPFAEDERKRVHDALERELDRWGVTLRRMSIFETKFLNEKLAETLTNQSSISTESAIKVANLNRNALIIQNEQEAKSRVDAIQRHQENLNKINAAKAEYEAAKHQAEATKAKALAEAEAIKTRGEAEAKAKEAIGKAETAVLKEKAALLEKNGGLLQLLVAEQQYGALSNIKSINVTSKEFGSIMSAPQLFFAQPQLQVAQTDQPADKKEKELNPNKETTRILSLTAGN